MASIFTRIMNGEIPCHKVAEDEDFFAFMDIRPINRGHVLVVSKIEEDYLFDLSDEILSKALVFAKPIAKALDELVECERVAVIVAGLEIPHAHIHLIPFNAGNELTFERAAPADQDELRAIAEQLRRTLQ